MTKEVLLSLKGLQYNLSIDRGEIETITPALYYQRNGNHYLVFDEIQADSSDVIKNRIKFRDDYLEVTKNGAYYTNLIFEKKKKNITKYATPFGEFIIGVDTDKVKMTEEEKRIFVQVDYSLDINYVHMADCKISVDVRDRESGLSLS
ncbi:MAG: DUF1934 domain-containing protein [Lachnospiraceae bacterium]|nr:DUF1934 domain-containing protein [Lachnospiraceae bacterium]